MENDLPKKTITVKGLPLSNKDRVLGVLIYLLNLKKGVIPSNEIIFPEIFLGNLKGYCIYSDKNNMIHIKPTFYDENIILKGEDLYYEKT